MAMELLVGQLQFTTCVPWQILWFQGVYAFGSFHIESVIWWKLVRRTPVGALWLRGAWSPNQHKNQNPRLLVSRRWSPWRSQWTRRRRSQIAMKINVCGRQDPELFATPLVQNAKSREENASTDTPQKMWERWCQELHRWTRFSAAHWIFSLRTRTQVMKAAQLKLLTCSVWMQWRTLSKRVKKNSYWSIEAAGGSLLVQRKTQRTVVGEPNSDGSKTFMETYWPQKLATGDGISWKVECKTQSGCQQNCYRVGSGWWCEQRNGNGVRWWCGSAGW